MFKRLAVCSLFGLLSLAAFPLAAQNSRWAAADDPTAKSLLHMEQRWTESECDGNLESAGFLADDFQGTAPDGTRYSKTDMIERTKNTAYRERDCKLGEARVRFFGDSVALIYGSESYLATQTGGKPQTQTLIWTDTWIKRNGKWQIIAAQDTLAHQKP